MVVVLLDVEIIQSRTVWEIPYVFVIKHWGGAGGGETDIHQEGTGWITIHPNCIIIRAKMC